MRSLRPPRPHPRRWVPPPLYGAASPQPLLRGSRPRGPGGASRTAPGNRGVPARGVDVKPPLREPGTGLPGPLEGPRRALRTGLGPREGSGRPRGLRKPPDPGPGPRARGVLHQPLAPGPRGSPGRPGGPSGPEEAKSPKKEEFGQNSPKYPILGGPPGKPRKRPFLGLRGFTGGSPRGVDVKPPSRGGPETRKMPKKGYFPGKVPKSAFLAKNGQNGHFWGFWAPPGLPGTRSQRGFYINPSRRGPAVPRRGSPGRQPRPGAGRSPKGAAGVSPGRGA